MSADEAARVAQHAYDLIELGRPIRALELLTDASRDLGPSPLLAARTAHALRFLSRDEDALQVASDALMEAPDDPGLLFETVQCLVALERARAALPLAEHLLARHPEDLDAMRAYVRAASNVPERRRRAVEVARRAVDSHPGQPSAFIVLGDALDGVGDRDGARAAYEQVLRLNPQDRDAPLRLARLKVRRGNIVALLRTLVQDLRTNPGQGSRGSADFLSAVPALLVVGTLALLAVGWPIGWLLAGVVAWGQFAWVVAVAVVGGLGVLGAVVFVVGAGPRAALAATRAGVLQAGELRGFLPWLADLAVLQAAALVAGWPGLVAVLPVLFGVRVAVALRGGRRDPAVAERAVELLANGPTALVIWATVGWPVGALQSRLVPGGRELWAWTIGGQLATTAVLLVAPPVLLGWRRFDAVAAEAYRRDAQQAVVLMVGCLLTLLLTQLVSWWLGWWALAALVPIATLVGLLLTPWGRRWRVEEG